MIHPRNDNTNRNNLFREIFGNIENCTIFDYGGSTGNLLYFSNGEIKENLYTCLDIVEEAIIKGKEEFPSATFVHYDRYNWMYNHSGKINSSFPDIDKNQDYIWAYSVFTHTDLDEFVNTVKWLTTFNYKKIAISFLTFNEMLEWAYNKRSTDYGSCIDIKKYINADVQIMYLFDNDKIVINQDKLLEENYQYLLTFYNPEFLKEKFSSNNIKINILYPGNGYIPFLVIENDNV